MPRHESAILADDFIGGSLGTPGKVDAVGGVGEGGEGEEHVAADACLGE